MNKKKKVITKPRLSGQKNKRASTSLAQARVEVAASTTMPKSITPKRSYGFQIGIGMGVAGVVALAITYLASVDISAHVRDFKAEISARWTYKQKARMIEQIEVSDVAYVGAYETIKASLQKDSSLVIIDLRPAQDYKRQHIKSSLSVPFDDVHFTDRIQKALGNKRGVLMGYSNASMQAESTAQKLAREGLELSVLRLGWNELYNLPQLWVPENAWKSFTPQDWLEIENHD